MKCGTCDIKFHIKCGGITPKEYMNLKRGNRCRLPNFSDSYFEVEDSTQLNQTVVEQLNQDSENIGGNMYDDLNEKLSASGLKIAYFNINGLFLKMNEIKFLSLQTKMNVFGITEAHLFEQIKDEEIFIE